MTVIQLRRLDPLQNSKVAAALATNQTPALEAIEEEIGTKFDVDLLEGLIAHALKTHSDIDKLDQWLAARIHFALRLPRNVASDPGVWTWLAVGVARPYVERRWKVDITAKYPWWRYNDTGVLRNGVARLWWAAELVRSGPDYGLVSSALRLVRVFQNVGELRYSWHREAARAFTRVLTEYEDVGDELSVVFNAYLATQCLETFDTALSDVERTSWDREWGARVPSLKELLVSDDELEGPEAGYARRSVEDQLYVWLKDMMDAAKTEKS